MTDFKKIFKSRISDKGYSELKLFFSGDVTFTKLGAEGRTILKAFQQEGVVYIVTVWLV